MSVRVGDVDVSGLCVGGRGGGVCVGCGCECEGECGEG